jgi:hypothetical protein
MSVSSLGVIISKRQIGKALVFANIIPPRYVYSIIIMMTVILMLILILISMMMMMIFSQNGV